MQRVIEIPGYGEVEFPDTMSDSDIDAAAKRLYDEQNKPKGFTPAEIEQNRAASKATFEQNQPSMLGGFLSEAKKNALKLGKTMLDVTGGQYPVSTGMESTGNPLLDLAHGVLGGGTTAPASAASEAIGAGIRSLSPSAFVEGVKASPAAELAKSAGNAVSGALKQFYDRPRDPVVAMTKGLKPLATNVGFEKAVNEGLPFVKAAEADLGKPVESVQDFLDATKLAKKKLWGQYEEIVGPQAARAVDASPVADAIEKSIPLKLKVQNPAAAEKIQAIADTYRARPYSISELDDLLTSSNAELSSYYGKYPAARKIAENANPDIAQNVAEANALRKVLYSQLDQGGAGAARDIKKAYGSLMNLEKEGQRRLNVAARQNPDSLSEQLSRWNAVMQTAKGAGKVLTGNPAGLGDIMAGYAGRKVASAIKEANSADALIANAFKYYKSAPPAFATQAQAVRQPVALLNKAPIFAEAAPDTSYVTAVPARYGSPVPKMPPEWALSAVGKAIDGPGRMVNDLITARMSQLRDMVRGGATENMGKAFRDATGEVVGKGRMTTGLAQEGGPEGYRLMFPELKNFSEPPGVIAAAIERGSGVLYERIKKAMFGAVRDIPVSQSETSFDFGANASPRARQLEALRSLVR